MTTTIPNHQVSNRAIQAKGILHIIEKAYQPDQSMFSLEFDNGNKILILADAKHVQYWLENDDHFTKDMHDTRTSSALGRIQFGQSLTFAHDGEEWRQLRTLTTPTVNPKQPSLIKATQDAANWLSDYFGLHSVIDDAWPLCLEWATRCVLEPFLGQQITSSTAIKLVKRQQEVFFYLVNQAQHQTKAELYIDPVIQAFRTELALVIKKALQHASPEDTSIISQLSNRLDLKNNPNKESSITDLLMGNLLGSIDNPASTLLWCLIYLANNPDVIKKIRQESHDIAHRDWSIQRCPTTIATIKECLRLSPVQPLVERTTTRDIGFGDITITKGTNVLFCPWLIHRNEKFWPRPLEFDIDRFTQRKRPNPAQYFPFGSGPRVCVGMSLALNQLAMALISLCHDHDWSLDHSVTPPQLRAEFKLNMRPRGPVCLNTSTYKASPYTLDSQGDI